MGLFPINSPSSKSDVEEMTRLMARLAAGPDRDAFAMLFAFYAPRLKAYMRRLGSDESAAEDLVQEAMATVWNKAKQFDPAKAGVGTWVFTIARNRRIDLLRREKRPEIDLSDPSLMPEEQESPEQIVSTRHTVAAVRAALAQLPPDQASIVKLAFFEEHPHSAIAKALGVPLGTVKSRMRLAFQRFRKALEEQS